MKWNQATAVISASPPNSSSTVHATDLRAAISPPSNCRVLAQQFLGRGDEEARRVVDVDLRDAQVAEHVRVVVEQVEQRQGLGVRSRESAVVLAYRGPLLPGLDELLGQAIDEVARRFRLRLFS